MTDQIPELSSLAQSFKPGIYKHFKGGLYEGLCVGRNSEARDQEYVVYRSLDKGHIWIRPLGMFFEQVERDEYKGPRFILIREEVYKKLILDIQVHDLDRAVKFYKEILNLPLLHKDTDWASFEAMGAEIHLYLHGGVEYGMEFRVSNIKEQIQVLEKKGVEFFADSNSANLIKITNHVMEFSWGKSTHFKDSEGNILTLVEDEKVIGYHK